MFVELLLGSYLGGKKTDTAYIIQLIQATRRNRTLHL